MVVFDVLPINDSISFGAVAVNDLCYFSSFSIFHTFSLQGLDNLTVASHIDHLSFLTIICVNKI